MQNNYEKDRVNDQMAARMRVFSNFVSEIPNTNG